MGCFGWVLNRQGEPAFVAAVVLAWALDREARLEERWLRECFPEYENYARQVRRFVSRLYCRGRG